MCNAGIFIIRITFLIFTRKCPKQYLNLGPSRIEECKATALNTQPPWPDDLFEFTTESS